MPAFLRDTEVASKPEFLKDTETASKTTAECFPIQIDNLEYTAEDTNQPQVNNQDRYLDEWVEVNQPTPSDLPKNSIKVNGENANEIEKSVIPNGKSIPQELNSPAFVEPTFKISEIEDVDLKLKNNKKKSYKD